MTQKDKQNIIKWQVEELYNIINQRIHLINKAEHTPIYGTNVILTMLDNQNIKYNAKNGKYPTINVEVHLKEENRLLACYSKETEDKYIVVLKITQEDNKHDKKPRDKGTRVDYIFTFDTKEPCYTTEVFENMSGKESLSPQYYERTTYISADDIETEQIKLEEPATIAESPDKQIKLFFVATQKDNHLPILATALANGLTYNHSIALSRGLDSFTETYNQKDNAVLLKYQHNTKPYDQNKEYEIIIEVTPTGAKIYLLNNNETVFSYSSYEQFIEHLEIDMDSARYLDFLKARVQTLQELGIPLANSEKNETDSKGVYKKEL